MTLPENLIEYADEVAEEQHISRSRFVAECLAARLAKEEEELAAEGYRFYAEESTEFAKASLRATSEAFDRDR